MSGGKTYVGFNKFTYEVSDVCLYLKKKVSTEHHLTDKARDVAQTTLKNRGPNITSRMI